MICHKRHCNHDREMACTTRIVRRYDHRLRDLVQSTGDIGLATQHGIPRSTARGWLTPARTEVVTLDVMDMSVSDLRREVVALRVRVDKLTALLRLLVILIKVSGVSLARSRLSERARNLAVLQADRRMSALDPG